MTSTKYDALPSENVIQKVQKLLALTQSPNEHEAALAAERAMELVTKYNLDMAQIRTNGACEESEVTQESFPMGKRSAIAWRWMAKLGSATARACYCQCLLYERQRMLVFIGRPINITTGKLLYQFLQQQMLDMAEMASRAPWQTMHRSRFKSSYLVGMAEKVAFRLKQKRLAEEAANIQTTALVIHTASENDIYVAQNFKLTDPKYNYTPEIRALHVGYAAGDRVQLEQGPAALEGSQ